MNIELNADRLIVPIYINEKIVLDMLAIMDDGFSMVSQVSHAEQRDSNHTSGAEVGVSTSSTILSRLLKINISGELNHAKSRGKTDSVTKEKVHTNVSLLSKFRGFLADRKMLKTDFDVSKIRIGDFIEVEGELQKNPLINYMDQFLGIFRMADIFTEKPQLGSKNRANNQKQTNNEISKQIKSFAEELKHSGTVDFILSDKQGTAVLSAQEQYLANDNVSEIIGGRFKVLGKVISICKDETEHIDLLRKTSLSILPEKMVTDMFSDFKNNDIQEYNFPELITKISGPAVIVIPIAIYA